MKTELINCLSPPPLSKCLDPPLDASARESDTHWSSHYRKYETLRIHTNLFCVVSVLAYEKKTRKSKRSFRSKIHKTCGFTCARTTARFNHNDCTDYGVIIARNRLAGSRNRGAASECPAQPFTIRPIEFQTYVHPMCSSTLQRCLHELRRPYCAERYDTRACDNDNPK